MYIKRVREWTDQKCSYIKEIKGTKKNSKDSK